MASSIVITLNDSRSQADMARFVKSVTDPRAAARALQHLFLRLEAGNELANWTTQQAAATAVRASATITLTNGSIANNDTLTIAGVVFTAKTSGATGAQFNIGGSAILTAANILAAVNANTTANVLVLLTASATGVITVTAQAAGKVGNFIPLTTSNGTGFGLSAATLGSGAGGSETAPLFYSRGL